MAYQIPITIREAIQNIQKKKYVLPSIQREFVWSPDQIEKLFDSLMRSYPISTFLFWKVEKGKIKDFQFYEFLKDYHEKNQKHNQKSDLSEDEDIVAILDGQQRLTSLYIALKGTYAKKIPYYRWDSPHAFPKKRLYLNILQPADDIELEYDFQFLSDKECKSSDNEWWFPVGEVLGFKEISDVMQYLMINNLTDTAKYSKDQTVYALNTLSKLFKCINENGSISYFQEEGEELDKVLQIFIRINSGGTKLSYSDLLLSVATAQWKEKDAREEIHLFVDELNRIGDGFEFNKDFVLKSCLVLGDFKDIKFKVDNFKKENMILIESKWEDMREAIRNAAELVSRFGFSRDTLTANNALIPISYFIYKNEYGTEIIDSSSHSENRKLIKEWLIRSLLRKIWGGTPDALYPVYRNYIAENSGEFPLTKLIDHYKGTNKSLSFNDDDIEQLLKIEYGSSLAYSALSLLYPGLIQSRRYHVDHIHPQRYFTNAKLASQGIELQKQEEYQSKYNRLANLQLLPATENTEKSGKPFEDWLINNYSLGEERRRFLDEHSIPADVSRSFQDFIDFYEERKVVITKKIALSLGVVLKGIDL